MAIKADISSLNGLATKKELENKANSTDVYTKTEIDNKNYLTAIPDTYASKEYVTGEIAKIPAVDLSAYSTTEQNDTKYQPKGDYLTKVPAEYITDTELTAKDYATKTELSSKAEISAIPSKVSQLTNDSGYVTDISGKVDKTELSKYALKAELPTVDVTKAYVDEALAEKADKTTIPDISDLATKNELVSGLSTKADISLLNGKVDKVEDKSLISIARLTATKSVIIMVDQAIRTLQLTGQFRLFQVSKEVIQLSNVYQIHK